VKDLSKTNAELTQEISVLKQKIQELEQLVLDHKKVEETLRESEQRQGFFMFSEQRSMMKL